MHKGFSGRVVDGDHKGRYIKSTSPIVRLSVVNHPSKAKFFPPNEALAFLSGDEIVKMASDPVFLFVEYVYVRRMVNSPHPVEIEGEWRVRV